MTPTAQISTGLWWPSVRYVISQLADVHVKHQLLTLQEDLGCHVLRLVRVTGG